MRPEEFLKEFGHLAATEGGITRLRGLIREMAATGRLSTARCDTATLGDVALDLKNGLSKRTGKSGTLTPVLRLADIKGGEISVESLREILLSDSEREQYAVERDDILIIRVNGSADLVGSFIPCRGRLGHAYSDHLIRLRLDLRKAEPQFICVVAGSTRAREHIVGKTVSTAGQKTVNQKGLSSLPFLLPPLPEQKRIVEKVDQLMALCDELEAKQKQKRAKAVAFNKAALSAVVHAPDKSQLKGAWSRVQDHFEVLYELPENVKELRQTILQLAVMGKLVRQEGGDDGEPPIDSVGTRQGPFALLNGWKWVSLAEIGRTQTGTTPSTKESKYWGQGVPFVTPGDLENFTIRTPNKCLTPDGLAVGREVAPGSILMVCIGGSLGKLAKTEIAVSCNQQINALTPVPQVDCDYVMFALASGYFQAEAWRRAGQGTLPIISKGKWERIPVPLPPSSLQPRISAKIRFIMNMCDDLEVKLAQHRDQGQRLMQAVVEGLVA